LTFGAKRGIIIAELRLDSFTVFLGAKRRGVAKKVSLPDNLHLTLKKMAAKRGRSVNALIEQIASEWIRHTRALERRVSKSIFHVASSSPPAASGLGGAIEPAEQGSGLVTRCVVCGEDDTDSRDPTIH
jgi:hypothetical protein